MDALPPQIPHQEPVAEVRQAPLRKNAFDIDPKNPVITLASDTSWKVSGVFKTGDKIAVNSETAGKIKDILLSPEKKEFLRKLYASSKETQPLLKKAIEDQAVQVYEIPWRNLYAVSLSGKNIDYLYDKEGKEYFNVYDFRKKEVIGDMVEGLLESRFQIGHQNLNWSIIYSQNGKPIKLADKDFLGKFTTSVDRVIEFRGAVFKEAEKRRKMEQKK